MYYYTTGLANWKRLKQAFESPDSNAEFSPLIELKDQLEGSFVGHDIVEVELGRGTIFPEQRPVSCHVEGLGIGHRIEHVGVTFVLELKASTFAGRSKGNILSDLDECFIFRQFLRILHVTSVVVIFQ